MTRRRILILKLLLLIIVVSLVSLVVWKSNQKDATHSNPEDARKKLTEKNIELTADAFVKSVRDGNVEAVNCFSTRE